MAALLVVALLSGGVAFAHAHSAGTYIMTDDQGPQIFAGFGMTKMRTGEPFTMQVIVASISRDATLTLRPLTFPNGLQRHLHVVGETAVLRNIAYPNRSYSRPYKGPTLPPLPMMRAMSVLMRPLNPVLVRQVEAGVLMDTTDMTFDPTETLKRFPMRLTPLEEVVRSRVAAETLAV